MTILEGIFLGLLQGFTEFLPISSSGHLLLAQKIFDIEANLLVDVLLHLGTLAAVLLAMRKSVWQAVRHPVADKRLLYVAVASLPTFAIALAVKLLVSEELMNKLLPIGFAATIVLIVLSDKLAKPKLRLTQGGLLPVTITGVVQGIAVFPGLSRSGSTISAMKLLGINGSDSAEFSFLLSVPVIAASAAVELLEAMHSPQVLPWGAICAGIAAAFLSGTVSVYMVMRAVKRNRWTWFALYLAFPLVLSLIVMF